MIVMNIRYFIEYISVAAMAFAVSATMNSCSDDYPDALDAPYSTDLLSIKVINAGAEQNLIYEGTIDEEKKMVSFKRFDPSTDFSNLKVEATVSEGAELDSDVIDATLSDEETEKTVLLRVKNHTRYKDYFVRIRKKVPVYGADWDKATLYDFTGGKIADAASGSTRWADFDGNHVLLVSRNGGVKPELFSVTDLKAGTIDSPKILDVTGIAGGTFPISCGALRNGHIYVSNLSGGGVSPLKIYYWDTPDSAPENILNSILADDAPNANTRHGDNASFNIGAEGNGYVFFGSNNGADFIRYSVTTGKTVGGPKVLTSFSGANSYPTIFRIGGTSDFVFSGINAYPRIVSEENKASAEISGLSGLQITACQIVVFNEERYLLTCSVNRNGSGTSALRIYDITKGSSLSDAVALLNANPKPIYEFVLGSDKCISPGTVVNYSIQKDAEGKDSVLSVFAFSTQMGFVIVDFPIKVTLDD